MRRDQPRLSRRRRGAPAGGTLLACATALSALVAGPGPAAAAVGIGTSPSTIVDTVPPVLALDPIAANLLLRGGESVTFHWSTADSHPGTTAADYVAEVRDGQVVLEAIDYLADPGDAHWTFTAPDISSGYLRAVVTCRDALGNTTTAISDQFSVILSTSPVPGAAAPAIAAIEGSHPNPCNPGTTVRFALPASQVAVLELYDAAGTRVRRLAEGAFAAGSHEVYWDGRDDGGRAVASGTYLLRLVAGATSSTRKLALVR